MHSVARVHDVQEGRVRLACEAAASACGACSSGRGCALRWLARPGGPMLDVPTQEVGGRHLEPGDAVLIEVDDGELLRAALLAYLPPMAGLIAGPVAAGFMAPGDELAALGAAALGLGLGWGLSRAWLRRAPPRYRLERTEPA